MRRAELPAEVDRQPLAYPELIEVLTALAGERVIVRADASPEAPGLTGPPGLSVAGTLTVETGPDEDVSELAIGDREGEGGGRLRIAASALTEANLSTFDGNDFVIVRLRMPGLSIQVQDEHSGAL